MSLPLLADVVTAAGTDPLAEQIMFWIFASVAIGAGIAVVAMRNIVHAALMLVLNFLCIAGLYLTLQSSFLSIVQIIVYAGAIVVLFLFVIMLLGVDRDDLLTSSTRTRAVGAVVAGVLLAGAFVTIVGTDSLTDASACGALAVEGDGTAVECVGMDAALGEQGDSVTVVASRLFTRWTVPFEASALLLVVATLGALVLGRRRDPAIEDDDAELLALAAEELDELEDGDEELDADAELAAVRAELGVADEAAAEAAETADVDATAAADEDVADDTTDDDDSTEPDEDA